MDINPNDAGKGNSILVDWAKGNDWTGYFTATRAYSSDSAEAALSQKDEPLNWLCSICGSLDRKVRYQVKPKGSNLYEACDSLFHDFSNDANCPVFTPYDILLLEKMKIVVMPPFVLRVADEESLY